MEPVKHAKTFFHVFVIVGDNDAKTKHASYFFQKIEDSVWPTEVKFAGHVRRTDLPQKLVSKNNMYLLLVR